MVIVVVTGLVEVELARTLIKTSVSMSPFKKAAISRFRNCQPLETEMATSNLNAASDAVNFYPALPEPAFSLMSTSICLNMSGSPE